MIYIQIYIENLWLPSQKNKKKWLIAILLIAFGWLLLSQKRKTINLYIENEK